MTKTHLALAFLLLIGSLWAANLTTSATINASDYKDLTATKAGDYSYTVKDKLGATLSTDTVKNTIDKPTNTLKDCNVFDCELKIQITPSKELSLEKDFIKGLASKPGVTFDKPFFSDIRQIERTRPTYKDVLEESCTSQIDNKTSKNTTVCQNITVQKETGTETYMADEAFENTDISRISTTTTIILRAHKTNMNLVVDLGYSIYGQERWDAAWWDTSYANRFLINCTNIDIGTVIAINGSNGFTINGVKQVVWTTCNTSLYLYYNSDASYAVVQSDTTQQTMEVEAGNVSSYGGTATMWRNAGVVARYGFNENASLKDSANYKNLTQSGTIYSSLTGGMFAGGGIGAGGVRSGKWYAAANSYGNLPKGNGASTEMAWAKPASATTMDISQYGSTSDQWRFNSLNGTLGYQPSFGGARGGDQASGLTLTTSWQLVGYTYDGANKTPYLNTTKGTVGTPTGVNTGSGFEFEIGLANDVDGYTFSGALDEFRIYNSSKGWKFINDTYYNAIGTAGYGTLGASEIYVAATNITCFAQTETPQYNGTMVNYTITGIFINPTASSQAVNLSVKANGTNVTDANNITIAAGGSYTITGNYTAQRGTLDANFTVNASATGFNGATLNGSSWETFTMILPIDPPSAINLMNNGGKTRCRTPNTIGYWDSRNWSINASWNCNYTTEDLTTQFPTANGIVFVDDGTTTFSNSNVTTPFFDRLLGDLGTSATFIFNQISSLLIR